MRYLLNIHEGYVESNSNVSALASLETDEILTDTELVKRFMSDYRSYFDNDLDTRECCVVAKKSPRNKFCASCGAKLDSLQTAEEKAAEHFQETFWNGTVDDVGGEFALFMEDKGWHLWASIEEGNSRLVSVYYFEDMMSGERKVERHLISGKSISVEVTNIKD